MRLKIALTALLMLAAAAWVGCAGGAAHTVEDAPAYQPVTATPDTERQRVKACREAFNESRKDALELGIILTESEWQQVTLDGYSCVAGGWPATPEPPAPTPDIQATIDAAQ